jgi:hypothetical protein
VPAFMAGLGAWWATSRLATWYIKQWDAAPFTSDVPS